MAKHIILFEKCVLKKIKVVNVYIFKFLVPNFIDLIINQYKEFNIIVGCVKTKKEDKQ